MTTQAKIIFYSLLGALVIGLGAVIYFIVAPSGSTITQTALEKISKSVIEKGISSASHSSPTQSQKSASSPSWGSSSHSKVERAETELKFSAEVQAQLNVIKDLFSQGRTEDALKKALELKAEFPNEAAFKAVSSDLLFSKGEYSEAADVLAELILDKPRNFALRVRQADALELAGRNDESYAAFTQILSDDPSNGKAMLGLLKQGEVLDRRQDAQAILENAFSARPSVDGALVLADVYAMAGDSGRRDQMYSKAKEIDPNHSLLNRVLSVDAMARGDWSKAEDYVDLAISNSDQMDEKILSVEAFTDAAMFKGRKDLALRGIQKLKDMGAPDHRIAQVEERLELFEEIPTASKSKK
jgi:tetratricopeptide (TPR) repeat protein